MYGHIRQRHYYKLDHKVGDTVYPLRIWFDVKPKAAGSGYDIGVYITHPDHTPSDPAIASCTQMIAEHFKKIPFFTRLPMEQHATSHWDQEALSINCNVGAPLAEMNEAITQAMLAIRSENCHEHVTHKARIWDIGDQAITKGATDDRIDELTEDLMMVSAKKSSTYLPQFRELSGLSYSDAVNVATFMHLMEADKHFLPALPPETPTRIATIEEHLKRATMDRARPLRGLSSLTDTQRSRIAEYIVMRENERVEGVPYFDPQRWQIYSAYVGTPTRNA